MAVLRSALLAGALLVLVAAAGEAREISSRWEEVERDTDCINQLRMRNGKFESPEIDEWLGKLDLRSVLSSSYVDVKKGRIPVPVEACKKLVQYYYDLGDMYSCLTKIHLENLTEADLEGSHDMKTLIYGRVACKKAGISRSWW